MSVVASPTFLDTNVLVFASIDQAPRHAVALSAIQVREQAGVDLWISRQVLREYLAVLSRPQTFTPPLPVSVLVNQVRAFESRFHVAADTAEVTSFLLDLIQQIPVGGSQVHDANIVATMQACDIHYLVTDNTSDFRRFARLITVLPLVQSELDSAAKT
jgi:predicted nucleic acid-binding protein